MKKKICLLLIILLTIITIPIVKAEEEGLLISEDVKVEENVKKTTFAFGNNVDLNAIIDGSSFIAGNNVNVKSTQDYLFAAGNNINIDKTSTKDAFVAGNIINIKESSIRDLYAAGSTVRVDGKIERNAYLAGDSITINSVIDGNVYIEAENVRIGKNAQIKGTLYYPENANASISESAIIENQIKSSKLNTVNKQLTLIDILTNTLYSYLSMLLIGFVLMYIFKKYFKKIEKQDKSSSYIVKTALIGLGLLVLLPLIAIIIMLSGIGIALGIISLIMYFILIYLAVIPASYYLGNHFLKDKIKNKYLIMALSLLIVYVVRLFPVIGGLISLIISLLGLGLNYNILVKVKD